LYTFASNSHCAVKVLKNYTISFVAYFGYGFNTNFQKMNQLNIFADKYFKQKLDNFNIEDIPDIELKKNTISKYIKALESGRIDRTKEESIQADFLNNFFGDVLGYDYKDSQKWNLEKENKSLTDASKADGALGFFSISEKEIISDVRVVVELKDALTDLDKPQHRLNDKRTPVEQAFSYSSKAGGKCRWVILSNFKEIRLYHSSDQGCYESFIVTELLEQENIKRFFYILQKEHLISESSESLIEKLYRERQEIEQTITKKFYNEYKNIRLELFTQLKNSNPDREQLLLFNKTQKLLDRFIFVCFCEDAGLLPPYTLKKTKDILKNAFDLEPNKLWRQLKGLFHSIDIGNPPLDINRFNGGLFAKDDELDNLVINDEILLKLIDFSEYDFASDINVNILGHIFEQSLSDIEEIKAEIGNGKELSTEEKTEVKKNGRRKKEGIFYTPEYITRYIVKESVGGWLDDRKKESGFYELPELTPEDYQSIKTEKKKSKDTGKFVNMLTYNSNIEKHILFWESYKDKLQNIKVLDPACGSGAFLNQVFDFLYKEGQMVNDQLSQLKSRQRELFDLDKHILTNNIFGVDLNSESVEITKLSLWLKTAIKGKELTALDENIKCGNSLIDDPEIAGAKTFNWFTEFPQVFQHYKIPKSIIPIEPEPGDRDFLDEVHDPSYSYKPKSKGFEKYGFDVIVGNPPYGTTFNDKEKEYLIKFDELVPDYEIYIYFISKGACLLKNKGVLSYIFPNTFLSRLYGKSYRQNILKNYSIISITDLSNDPTFEDASVRTCIFSFEKNISDNSLTKFNTIDVISKNIMPIVKASNKQLEQNIDNWLILFSYSPEKEQIIDKIRIHPLLKEICEVSQGYIPYRRSDLIKQFGEIEGNKIVDQRLWHSETKINEEYIQEILGKDINKYFYKERQLFIKYGKHVASYVDVKFFISPRILIREIAEKTLFSAYIENEFCNSSSMITVIQKVKSCNLKFLLAILNSKLIGYYHYNTSPKAKKGLFPKILVNDVRNIPIPDISTEKQQAFIEKANIMLLKNKELFEIKEQFINVLLSKFDKISRNTKIESWHKLSFPEFSKELQKQKIKLSLPEQSEWLSYFEQEKAKADSINKVIFDTDTLIDKMVYELYGLTKDEIKIIES